MPLTKEGRKMKRKFQEEYGRRGDSVFFAFLNKHPNIARKIGEKR